MNLLLELLLAARFSLVGLVATGVHTATAILLAHATLLPVLVVNLAAFLVAFGFSFAGNYLWTFRGSAVLGQALPRFFVVSVSALLASSLVLLGLKRFTALETDHAILCASASIPVITFLGGRLWGFRACR